VARMWERALRRARIPVAYTAGFSPRPKLSFGLALPTGCESLAEYLDIELADQATLAEVSARLEGQFPTGIYVTACAELTSSGGSLQQEVTSCTWDIEVPGCEQAALEDIVVRALQASNLPVRRQRKGRMEDDDLRPSVRSLALLGGSDGPCTLRAELSTRPRGVRPVELGQAIGVELGLTRRTHQWIEIDGSQTEPLAADAARPLEALERAS
jgi:radical SAM-linked protein